MSNRVRWIGVALGGLCVLVLLGALWMLSRTGGTSASDVESHVRTPTARRHITRPQVEKISAPAGLEAVETPPQEASEDAVLAAVEAAWPGKRLVRCRSGSLQEGWLRARPTHDGPGGSVASASVAAGELLAVVEGTEGEALIYEHLSAAARMTWRLPEGVDSGVCQIHPLVTHVLRGTVTDVDGSPAAEVEVRGCRHGDLSVTDAAGAFQTDAVEGTTCFPMAFLDREGVFARSNAPQVDVGRTPPPEVFLELEPGWTAEEQLMLMNQMSEMLERTAIRMTASNPASEAAQRASTPELAGVLWAWGQAQDDAHALIWDDLERLTREEDPYVAFRDLWMNQY
jgi:hypothetical protein